MTVVAAAVAGPGCEAPGTGLLVEPVAAVSSLAFVLAGALIVLRHHAALRGGRAGGPGAMPSSLAGYASLVVAVGLGSLVQHGPNPAYADLLHDLPLLATLAFVAADAVAALRGRGRSWWWWAVPTQALVPLILAAPRSGDLAQAGVAVVALGATLLRARTFPAVRREVGWAVGLLAVGGVVGTLSRAGWPLCDPHSLWQGHALWHVLAAAALVVLAPVIGTNHERPRPHRE
ncbi:hypothetical protein [Georgenia sp. MJ170]|uniref:hypothetical protein n=1 Tax=Georgenia sunbinii TaxID=3117728 RepID=UPI002F26106C